METNELLLHLTKKLESGEIYYGLGRSYEESGSWLYSRDDKQVKICLADDEEKYNEKRNDKFKENFYKNKGIKCWASKCSNKVCVKEGDHKKVKISCGEKHTRILCIEHSKGHKIK